VNSSASCGVDGGLQFLPGLLELFYVCAFIHAPIITFVDGSTQEDSMTRIVDVNTPENVRIEYELAGIGSRGLAAIVDATTIVLTLFVIAMLAWMFTYYGFFTLSKIFWTVLTVTGFLTFVGYYIYFESVWNGQTPGKRALGIRSVRDGGTPIDITAVTVRNLVRLIDMLPSMYVVGVLSIVFSQSNKRLGDYAAGTIVVKERPRDIGSAEHNWVVADTGQNIWRFVFDVYLVRPEEFEAARSYCDRRAELSDDVRAPLAARIAVPIMMRLGLSVDPAMASDFDVFLDELCSRCVSERGMR
jgi:uncharacterized RDD family membrane protein YckC